MTGFFRPLAGVVIAFALLSPAEASARGFVIVTWGETITPVGKATAEMKPPYGSDNVGFKYGYFGVFWIDLWTHGGTYCVYDGMQYNPISPAEAARLLGKSESELSTPFFYRWPPGWMIFGPPIVIWGVFVLLHQRGEVDVGKLIKDARYQRALEMLNERCATSAGSAPTGAAEGQNATHENDQRIHAAFQAAVDHLVGTGVPRVVAERNLAVLVQSLSQASRQSATAANSGNAEPGTAPDRRGM